MLLMVLLLQMWPRSEVVWSCHCLPPNSALHKLLELVGLEGGTLESSESTCEVQKHDLKVTFREGSGRSDSWTQ